MRCQRGRPGAALHASPPAPPPAALARALQSIPSRSATNAPGASAEVRTTPYVKSLSPYTGILVVMGLYGTMAHFVAERIGPLSLKVALIVICMSLCGYFGDPWRL
jgi:hypothetical protein